MEADGHRVRITASIGISLFPEHGREAEARVTWVRPIHEALDQNGFDLDLQPIIDLRSGATVHHEVLLRLLEPDGRKIPPDTFLEIAERFGLMRPIDHWVIRRTLQFQAELADAGRSETLSIHLSGNTFADSRFVPWLRAELETTAVTPRDQIFENAEFSGIRDVLQTQQSVDELEHLGYRLAFDDLGVGVGLFHHLKQLRADYLKIDGRFTRNLVFDTADQHLVKAMAQGNHIARPFPAQDLIR